jgi:hypothetical protein
MTALDDLLDLVPLATRKALAAAASNVLLVPAAPGASGPGLGLGPSLLADARDAPTAVPSTVGNGVLHHDDAGPAGGDDLPVRVVAVLGPGSSFAGLAATLLPFYTGATPAGVKPLTADELARGLAVYARNLLPIDDWSHFQVGLCLPLPIEVGAAGAWTLNVEKVRGWAATFPSGATARARLSRPPAALAVPEPAVTEGEARALRTGPAGVPVTQWERALRNPSEAVLTIFAILRQMQDGGPTGLGDAEKFALAFLATAKPHHVALLAATSAGNGLLRRLRTALVFTPPAGADARLTAARTLVARALFKDAVNARNPFPHDEVPQNAELLAVQPGVARAVADATVDPAGGLHRMVLGRDVAVGRIDAARVGAVTFKGPKLDGRLALDPFLKDDAAALTDPQVAGALALLALEPTRSSPFDAVKARDDKLLTVGLDNWSVTDPAGLPALLFKFNDLAPDEFDLFFRLHGLDVDRMPGDPTKFRLLRVEADGSKTVMDPATVQSFFGMKVASPGVVTISVDWAARFRLPALVSRLYRRAQVLLVVDRVKRTANPVELAIASVPPFPSAYALAFDGPRSTALKTAVTADSGPFMTAQQTAHVKSADTLSGALIDLTAGPGVAPAYASSHGTDDEDTFYVGSMNKVAALYAALELRFRLRKALAAAEAKGFDVTVAGWDTTFRAIVVKTWSARVAKGFPGLDTRMPARFPKLKQPPGATGRVDMFAYTTVAAPPPAPAGTLKGHIDFTKGTAADADIVALNLGRPDPSKVKFLELLKSMIFMSNAIAAGQVIDAVGYPYLNGALRDGGFFLPGAGGKQGIWLSANYDNNDWVASDFMKVSDRGKRHYKEKTQLVGNARQFARMLALADRHELFDKDADSCNLMLTIMIKNNLVHIDNSFNQNAVDATPEGVGARPAGAPPLKVDKVSSKIGIGVPAPPSPLEGAHDCAVIERKKGAVTLRYVLVITGGYTGSDGGTYDRLVQLMDGALARLH